MKKAQSKSTHIAPSDFDMNLHKGKFVTMNTITGIQSGVLVEFIDNIVKLKTASKSGFPVISQLDYSEIQTIIK